ncbi:oligouridylate-binding protein 1C-like [Andrographis paniculata]|uniref:oligouridylate-binding protein 1C-like n=1 Tax=Andrographis paniculata TaxID=175694 RepID=UPI0021E71ABF|nr:oligouridylate-binding protein 1C-like [Andrographis paniculata]
MNLGKPQTPSSSQMRGKTFRRGPEPSGHCRVFVGNLHPAITENILKEFFTIAGPVHSCAVFHNDESHYGNVVFENPQSAIIAIGVLNGASLVGKTLIVSWTQPTNPQEDQTTSYYFVTVDEFLPEITGDVLYAYFSVYDSCVEATVILDENSRPMGTALVSFRSQQHACRAAHELNGTMLEGRQIICALFQFPASPGRAAHSENSHHFFELSTPELPVEPFHVEGEVLPDRHFNLILVSKLSPPVTQMHMWTFFNSLGAGTIESCNIVPEKNCGFVRYSSQYEAALAIIKGDYRMFFGAAKITCHWTEWPNKIHHMCSPVPPELTAMLASARVRAHRLLKAHLRISGH